MLYDKTIEFLQLTHETYSYDPENPGRLKGVIVVRNKGEKEFYITLDNIAVDNIAGEGGLDGVFVSVLPGTEAYIGFWFSLDDWETMNFNGFQNMSMTLRYAPTYSEVWEGYGKYDTLNIILSKKSAEKLQLPQNRTKLIEENGVIFSLAKFESENGKPSWWLIAENTNDYGVYFEKKNEMINGKPDEGNSLFFTSTRALLAPHQSAEFELTSMDMITGNVSFTVDIYDYTRQQLLCSGQQKINLKTE